MDAKEWVHNQHDFVFKQGNSERIELDSAPYIHNISYKEIAEEIRKWIDKVDRRD